MEYKITECSNYHLAIEFKSYYNIGFIEYWKGGKVIYTNIFENELSTSLIKKIIRISKRNIFLYKLGLLKRR